MPLIDTTDTSQNERVTIEIELEHGPKKVWRALTDPVLMAEWLLPVVERELKLEKGSAFTLKAPQAYPGWDGSVQCKMLEVEPLKMLKYAWSVPGLDTIVTFTLTPSADGTSTRLLLVQSGFKEDQKQNWAGARYGLRMMGQKLIDLLDGNNANLSSAERST